MTKFLEFPSERTRAIERSLEKLRPKLAKFDNGFLGEFVPFFPLEVSSVAPSTEMSGPVFEWGSIVDWTSEVEAGDKKPAKHWFLVPDDMTDRLEGLVSSEPLAERLYRCFTAGTALLKWDNLSEKERANFVGAVEDHVSSPVGSFCRDLVDCFVRTDDGSGPHAREGVPAHVDDPVTAVVAHTCYLCDNTFEFRGMAMCEPVGVCRRCSRALLEDVPE